MLDKITVTFLNGTAYIYRDSIVDAFGLEVGSYDAMDPLLDDFWAANEMFAPLIQRYGFPVSLYITQDYLDNP